jgi:hypothetical protein
VGHHPGGGSTILHWKGSAWSASSSGTSNRLDGVWGSSASDVWAVGTAGTILHWNGSAWSASSSGTSDSFGSIWGNGASDVWAVAGGAILRHR